MSENIEAAIKELYRVIKEESSGECVSFTVFISCNGIHYEADHRDAALLKKTGVSMRNLRGNWIE